MFRGSRRVLPWLLHVGGDADEFFPSHARTQRRCKCLLVDEDCGSSKSQERWLLHWYYTGARVEVGRDLDLSTPRLLAVEVRADQWWKKRVTLKLRRLGEKSSSKKTQ
ncbi:hypothetical protein M6B38_353615 [Iris pallida]|uniref:Uncharacterized protein n=1 Tax=Iris pallida TaxID=29817 RepID=A0AAX6GPR7_IRIPA|nr:hypothetical protein M6B38_353615 [Iris pallida]